MVWRDTVLQGSDHVFGVNNFSPKRVINKLLTNSLIITPVAGTDYEGKCYAPVLHNQYVKLKGSQ